MAFTSCHDEDLTAMSPEEAPSFGNDVYSINFIATVDDMGTRGVYNQSSDPQEVTKWENYIDLERFRVLFFDMDDKFLFESKNRWVKQVEAGNSFSSWYVSVPLGDFGNDNYGEGQGYDWDFIRGFLTSNKFKIALLVNRPARLLYPGFIDSELGFTDGVFDNDGPYWGPEHTGKKTLFDLQHYQYDIIYTDKGEHGTKTNSSYYDFVMGEIDTDRPTMGAAINWVSFDNNDTDKELLSGTTYMRNVKMPSASHPIPMYGVQVFDAIPEKAWKPGSPFDISNIPDNVFPDDRAPYTYTSISLLRCCVRIDLKIPKTVMGGKKPTHLSLWYSNIYSRTEPMDNWTPTDQIWNQNNASHSDNNCEMSRLISYGPFVTNKDPGNGTTKAKYQERLKWFYGAWLDKGWKFLTKDNKAVTPTKTNGLEYPRIFNSCIQRNKVISCLKADMSQYYDDGYWHYIIYTGERNPNDVNSLPNMPSNPYISCFFISWDNTKFYGIPLLNYAKNNDDQVSKVFGPHSDGTVKNGSTPGPYNTYVNTNVPSSTGDNIPYPLIRNHIYTFTLKGTKSGDDDLSSFFIDSEVNATTDINFSKIVERAKVNKVFKNATVQTTNTTIK